MRDINNVRRHGYATFYEALLPDTGAVAVPFPSDMKGFPMAIGVGGLRDQSVAASSRYTRQCGPRLRADSGATIELRDRRTTRVPQARRNRAAARRDRIVHDARFMYMYSVATLRDARLDSPGYCAHICNESLHIRPRARDIRPEKISIRDECDMGVS